MQTEKPDRNLIKRFLKAKRGAVAVEFAIILLPFLVLMFGTVELGMVFMTSSTLQNATDEAARRIRTGEFQATSTTKAQFKTLVCNNMSWLKTSCAGNLTVDVQTFSDFGGIGGAAGIDPANFDPNDTCWSPGQAGDIVLVRTYYKWQIFTPFLDQSLVNMGDGSSQRLITTAASFRNEPWSTTAPAGAAC
ncbi:MAG: pilus assembly protein TadE [Alphaproteobacteria bacterium PA2]|nr:MAG: pilus assembly protein TadE [Alphaproteobacteria bacterium PA2]